MTPHRIARPGWGARAALTAPVVGLVMSLAALQPSHATESSTMDLGNFSVSLAVKDIQVSKAFYEKLGFVQVGGVLAQRWVVMQSGLARIGLFQGMFEKNLLTFNPGWSADKQTLAEFTDVRELQRTLAARGIAVTAPADEGGTGPAFFMVTDPDGNPLLFDQHVASPQRPGATPPAATATAR
ncbi:VOC family protein [Ideonella sp. DXS29W]|uniref:VOC family protein n=1 Tax=Ideonella lacteola TaxID=2984193 RepID=A0ABU9BX68_9BURK